MSYKTDSPSQINSLDCNTSGTDDTRKCWETIPQGALVFLHISWTEALTVFSWMFVQSRALEKRVYPSAKDRPAYDLPQRSRFLKLRLLSCSINHWVCRCHPALSLSPSGDWSPGSKCKQMLTLAAAAVSAEVLCL